MGIDEVKKKFLFQILMNNSGEEMKKKKRRVEINEFPLELKTHEARK